MRLPPPLPGLPLTLTLTLSRCVYPLLFRELLKMESKGSASKQCQEGAIVDVHRAALHRAMSAMHAVVMQVNEEVRAP